MQDHRLEKRARLLAQRMRGLSEGLAQQLSGPGDRALFAKRLTSAESLAWWREHRDDAYGKAVIQRWMAQDPAGGMVALQQLDAALANQIEAEQSAMGGL